MAKRTPLNPEYNATELAADVAQSTGADVAGIRRGQNATFRQIQHALKQHRRVEVIGFGTFNLVTVKARKSKDFNGRTFTVPEHDEIHFRQWGGADVVVQRPEEVLTGIVLEPDQHEIDAAIIALEEAPDVDELITHIEGHPVEVVEGEDDPE